EYRKLPGPFESAEDPAALKLVGKRKKRRGAPPNVVGRQIGDGLTRSVKRFQELHRSDAETTRDLHDVHWADVSLAFHAVDGRSCPRTLLAHYLLPKLKRSATGIFKRLAILSRVSNEGAFLPAQPG